MRRRFGLQKGITLIALVITIIILLILAGVAIATLTGDNSVVDKAEEAKEETKKAQIQELVQTEALGSYDSKGEFNSDKFKENVENHLKEYNPEITENEDSITVTIDGVEVVIDKETGDIYDSKNVRPKIETQIYQTNGNPIEEGKNYDNVIITVKVPNKDKFENLEIEIKDSNGNLINANNEVIGEGDASFTVKGEGTYTVIVKGTIEGEEKAESKTITIERFEQKVLPTVSFSPNGGTGYVMPSAGSATIKTVITSSNPSDGTVSYQYAWDTQNNRTPDNWKNTTSGTTISKTDCQVGNYYLWVKVEDREGKVPARIIVSKVFTVQSNAEVENQITLTPSKTEATNEDVIVTANYGKNLTQERLLTCTGNVNTDYIVNGTSSVTVKTNGQTVTASAKDIAGNTVTKSYTVNNITRTAPTVSVNSNETLAKMQTATVTIGDEDNGLAGGTYTIKYTWTTTGISPNWNDVTTTKTITVVAGAKTGTTTISKNDGTGTYYLHVQALDLKDQAGNMASPTAYGIFKLDNQGPTINFGINGNINYQQSQSTTVAVTDNGGDSVDTGSLKYQWSQSTVQPAENTFTQTFDNNGTITKSDGTGNNWYLWILAKDNLGNTTITKSNAFYLDNTAPTNTVPTASVTTNSITVNFTQTDAHSGINGSTKQYSIKKTTDSTFGAWVSSTNTSYTFTGLTLNTSYDVRTQVKDTAGNGYTVSNIKTITTANITKPTITLSNSGWTNQDITVTISYPDIAGITKQYSYDNSTWLAYTGVLTIDNNKTIYARSIDSLNQGSDSTRVASVTITNIDKNNPNISNLTATSDSITVNATDDLSGIVGYACTTSSSIPASFTTIASTKNFSEKITGLNDDTTYYVWVRDAAGNMANKTITTELGIPTAEGTTPYLPGENFKPVPDTDLDTGFVIEDDQGNQYVWVEVPRTEEVYPVTGTEITEGADGKFTQGEYDAIEEDLHTYTATYRNGTRYTDEYYSDDTTGLTEIQYNDLKETMLQSVYQKGGFWIGRYEVGVETSYRDYDSDTIEYPITETPVIKANVYPYNWVRCNQAQELASRMDSGNYISSLMFGVQWDLVLKYLEVKAIEKGTEITAIQNELNSNSISMGNYRDATYTLNRGKYAKGETLSIWYDYTDDLTNYVVGGVKQSPSSNYPILLTTGASDDTCKQNIYDIAGNVYELTLEYSSLSYNSCTSRGGCYNSLGSWNPAGYRAHTDTNISNSYNRISSFNLLENDLV